MSRQQSAYQNTQLSGMSPGKVVEAVLDGALRATTRAIVAAEEGHVAMRGEQVSQALALVGELQSSLDMEAGKLAEDLYALYDYAVMELLQGNIKNDAARFVHAETVLTEIHEGWVQMLAASEQAPTPVASEGDARVTDYA